MSPSEQARWADRLRPLVLAEGDLAAQLGRRRSLVLVGSGLLVGLILFILAIFASFERPGLGFVVGGALFGGPLGLIWWDWARLRARLAAYQREREAEATPG